MRGEYPMGVSDKAHDSSADRKPCEWVAFRRRYGPTCQRLPLYPVADASKFGATLSHPASKLSDAHVSRAGIAIS